MLSLNHHLKSILVCATISLVTLGSAQTVTAAAPLLHIDPSSVDAKAWVVIDTHSRQIISEHNADQKRAPASLTKMMVAYVVFQHIQQGKLNLNETITVPEIVNQVKPEESSLHLKPGEKITVRQLIAGLACISANDAALTLALRISGNIPNFVRLMNDTAKQLGLDSTRFNNPSGISQDGHYSTAHDLAQLSLVLVNDMPEYLHYSALKSVSHNGKKYLATNPLVERDSTIDGLKTGYTGAAGYNLALTAARPDTNSATKRRLIVVALGMPSKQSRANTSYNLLNVGYRYTFNQELFKADTPLANIPIWDSFFDFYEIKLKKPLVITLPRLNSEQRIQLNQTTNPNYLKQLDSSLSQNSYNPAHYQFNMKFTRPSFTGPVPKGVKLADLEIFQQNQLIHTVSFSSQVAVEQGSVWDQFMTHVRKLWYRISHTPTEAQQLLPKTLT